jgi:imidazoleglycerol phosphate synthase glutamine amidotransferase subunit HisH
MGLPWQFVDIKAQKLYIFQTITEATEKYYFIHSPKVKKQEEFS